MAYIREQYTKVLSIVENEGGMLVCRFVFDDGAAELLLDQGKGTRLVGNRERVLLVEDAAIANFPNKHFAMALARERGESVQERLGIEFGVLPKTHRRLEYSLGQVGTFFDRESWHKGYAGRVYEQGNDIRVDAAGFQAVGRPSDLTGSVIERAIQRVLRNSF